VPFSYCLSYVPTRLHAFGPVHLSRPLMSQEVQAVTSGEADMGDALHNKSANTDPQLKAAASPLMLAVRLPLR
jgi:hypothetical protein